MDNWQRLGLVTSDLTAHLIAPDAYDWVESNPVFTALRATHETESRKVVYEKGILKVTELGRTFVRVVIRPLVTPATEAKPETDPT